LTIAPAVIAEADATITSWTIVVVDVCGVAVAVAIRFAVALEQLAVAQTCTTRFCLQSGGPIRAAHALAPIIIVEIGGVAVSAAVANCGARNHLTAAVGLCPTRPVRILIVQRVVCIVCALA
jgi:hypothetical protein